MPWVGLQTSCTKIEELEEYLKSLGYAVSRRFEIEVLIDASWVKFTVCEVRGFTEGIAEVLSETFNCPALEGGSHLILGEVSAKLWDEAVRVVEPSGKAHVIPVYTFDGFLDVRMPTAKVRGLKGQIIIGGKTLNLPLTEEDLRQIMLLGKRVQEKLDKAIAVYGAEKILGKDLLGKLKSAKEEARPLEQISYDVDLDSGVVLLLVDGKLTSMRIPSFAVFLAQRENYDELKRFLLSLRAERLDEVKEALRDFYELYGRTLKAPLKLKKILEELRARVNEGTSKSDNSI